MKYAKIIILVLIGALLLYLPLSMLLGTAQAAEDIENMSDTEEVLPLPPELDDPTGSGLAPTLYTPENYVQPQYDPFNNKFRPDSQFEEKVEREIEDANTPPQANFVVRTPNGLADKQSGTTGTQFTFDAYSSRDNETQSSRLQVRWDFESDGEYDSYFSTRKNVKHTFEYPGTYDVTLEVLDRGGIVSTKTQKVVVVENTPPFAYVTYKPETGTTNQIFTFDVSESEDSQYKRQFLEYRFDWDSDGHFDTPYKKKSIWRHQFGEAGTYRVTLEVRDPEESSSFASTSVTVFNNTPPTASFTVEVKPVKVKLDQYRNKYIFDASGSFDPENTKKLRYRWDFNYTGENDIHFTTQWRSSPKHSGFYDFPGEKVVRLQVKDEDSAVTEVFANIYVE